MKYHTRTELRALERAYKRLDRDRKGLVRELNKEQARVLKLDHRLIGTKYYNGIAYFWNYEFRHYLRDASDTKRRKVHSLFIKAGLAIDGESKEHWKIVRAVTGLK